MSKVGSPEFFSPDVETNDLDEGSSVIVRSLEHLPKDIAEQARPDLVLKEYKTHFKNGEARFSEPLLETAKTLQEKQAIADGMFHDVLPNLVVHSHFVVGKNAAGDNTIFELQPKIDIMADVTAFRALDSIWSELDPDVRARARQELEKFVQQANIVREQEEIMLDLFGDTNLVLTTSGELRFIDTNKNFSKLNSPEMYEENAKRIDWIAEFLQTHP